LKVAIFCPNYPPSAEEGGISHYVRCLAHNLSNAGDNIFIIAGKEYCGSGEDGRIRVLRFPVKWNYRAVRQIFDQLRANNIEIINLQYSPVLYPEQFKLAWNYLTRNFVSTISFHTLWGGSKLNYLFAFNLLYTTNGVIATNSEVIYLLKKYFPFFLKKSHHIPIASNIKSTKPQKNQQKKIDAKFSIKPDEVILAYFGMAYPGKGMRLLFETAKILMCKYNLNFKLLVIGGGISDVPEYVEEKKSLARALGIYNRVIFTGRIASNEVSELLNASSVVLLPFTSGVSDRRGSLMAALSHKKAIVTTKPALEIDLFKNGENMVWPDQTHAENLADKVKLVLQNMVFRQRLENGAIALAQKYCWKDIAENTRNFFEILISNKKLPKYRPTGRKGSP
jgi:glycosyltransferase involved in cell wall biosynthesis